MHVRKGRLINYHTLHHQVCPMFLWNGFFQMSGALPVSPLVEKILCKFHRLEVFECICVGLHSQANIGGV
jgi:hypothetical protein